MDEAKWLQLATLLIPFIAPLITAGIKKLLPKIPKLVVVLLQPILGAILGALTGLPLEGAALGAGGLYVREVVDQSGKALGLIPPKAA